MLNGIQNFLQFVNNNWTTIVIIISLLVALYTKIKSFASKSTDEKIEVAKKQIREICLKLITDAEIDYDNWNKAGSIKRAQVIQKIFAEYPVLARVTDQEALVAWIDETINESLKELRKIVTENTQESAPEA